MVHVSMQFQLRFVFVGKYLLVVFMHTSYSLSNRNMAQVMGNLEHPW